MDECKFELEPLYCGECGAYIGVLGTCEDVGWCDNCHSRSLRNYEAGDRFGYDLIYSPQEERGKPPMHTAKTNLKHQ